MKKSILYSLLICTALYSNNDKEVFIEKYIDSTEFQKNQNDVKKFRENISEDVNLKEISKRESKDIDTTLKKNQNEESANIIAAKINEDVKSNEYQKKVQEYKDYILKDKELDFDGKMGNYKKEIGEEKGINYKNKFLKSDERLIIAISSSIPDEVIKNYFKSFGENYEDVLFVMNGFIGNDPKKIMPTIKYINGLLSKEDGAETEKGKEKYLFRVDINPKLFSKYKLEQVPAVIFVKNYNPFLEIQGNGLATEENEEVYISFGESSVRYALEQIEKDAKSEGLQKLIDKISKGFLNE